jgi:hypothetical protein
MIKSTRIRWAAHVAHRGIVANIGFWWESQKKRGHKEDVEVGGRIILKLILEK